MSGWQPIETAPKDWTRILLWANGNVFLCYWDAAFVSSWDEELDDPVPRGAWTDDTVKSFGYEEINEIINPTHWMQLPEPPK